MKRLGNMNEKELDAEIAELKRLRALMVDRLTRAAMRGEDDVNVDDIMAKVKMHECKVFGDSRMSIARGGVMGVLIIGPDEQAAIAAALERARAKPIPLDVLMKGAVDDRAAPKTMLSLAERVLGFERPASEHVMLGNYRAAVSFEVQPTGLCRHLSVSSQKPGLVPNEAVIEMVARAFGFRWPITAGRVWLEEFDPGHHAVNVVQVEAT